MATYTMNQQGLARLRSAFTPGSTGLAHVFVAYAPVSPGWAHVLVSYASENIGLHRGIQNPVAWTAASSTAGVWVFTWTTYTGVSYEVWLDGILLDTVTTGTYTYNVGDYETTPPSLEIHYVSVDKAENSAYPPYAIIQWRGLTGAAGYVVERYISDVWTVVRNLTERAAGWYAYATAVLDDDTDVQFRVKALDSKGTEGTPITTTVHLIRNPTPPTVTFTVTGGNLVMEAV